MLGQDLFGGEVGLGMQVETLKGKYKKSLQQMMQLLKVNNSLKNTLEQQRQMREQRIAQIVTSNQQFYQLNIQNFKKEIQNLKREKQEYSKIIAEFENRLKEVEKEKSSLILLLKQERAERSAQIQQLKKKTKPESGKNEVSRSNNGVSSIQKNKRKPQSQISQSIYRSKQVEILKEQIQRLQLQNLQNKRKYRQQLKSIIQASHEQKLNWSKLLEDTKTKNEQLQQQIAILKAPGYLQNKRDDLDEEHLFGNIKEQLHKISVQFQNYEEENSQFLFKKRSEEVQRINKISNLQLEIDKLREQLEKMKLKAAQSDNQKQRIEDLNINLKIAYNQRDQALSRNHVYQALSIIEKYRGETDLKLRVKQFEERMSVLLRQQNKASKEANSLQQIVILKAYILELNELLSQSQKQEESVNKKYSALKEQYSHIEKNSKAKIEGYKKKITNFDALVSKLYGLLEDKYKEALPQQIQKQFQNAISHYEQKMLSMGEQILKLRKKRQQQSQFYSKYKQSVQERLTVLQKLQFQNSQLKKINQTITESQRGTQLQIIQMSGQIQKKKAILNQNSNLQAQISNKNKIIESLNGQISSYLERDSHSSSKQIDFEKVRALIQKQKQILKQQLQNQRKNNKNLAKNAADSASLLEKNRVLELQLQKNKKEGSQKSLELSKDLSRQLSQTIEDQNKIIKNIYEQQERLKMELSNQKSEKLTMVKTNITQYNQLSRVVTELEKKLQQENLRYIQLQTEYLKNLDVIKTLREELEGIKNQNRGLTQQLASKHAEMMDYYQQLSRKSIQADPSQLQILHERIRQMELIHSESSKKYINEINEMSSHILGMRTNLLTTRDQIQRKEDIINDLKHQIYSLELGMQKQQLSSSFNSSQKNIQAGQQERLKLMLIQSYQEIQTLKKRLEQYQRYMDKSRQETRLSETARLSQNNTLSFTQGSNDNPAKISQDRPIIQPKYAVEIANPTIHRLEPIKYDSTLTRVNPKVISIKKI